MLLPSAILLAAAALATADTIPVSVGRDGLTFDPNVIRAHEGDVIEFRFWPRNHSVVAGHFSEACRPAEDNGFFSGFFPTQPDTVNVTPPSPTPSNSRTKRPRY
jgi:plastocyanin